MSSEMVPSSYRAVSAVASPLPASVEPLVRNVWHQILDKLEWLLPSGVKKNKQSTVAKAQDDADIGLTLEQFAADGNVNGQNRLNDVIYLVLYM
jgi:hypothetical protein